MINYLSLYKIFFYLRFVEETISNKYSEGKMRCPVHLSIGQEAISAIFSCLVKKKDFAISMHRPHAHYLAKGGNLNKMISELEEINQNNKKKYLKLKKTVKEYSKDF